MSSTNKQPETFELKTDPILLQQKIALIKWWEWIPIIGAYLYFARITMTRAYYIKPLKKGVNAIAKWFQISCGIVILPFAIWSIVLAAQSGWGFYLPSIGIFVGFGIEFATPLIWRALFQKGLAKAIATSETPDHKPS